MSVSPTLSRLPGLLAALAVALAVAPAAAGCVRPDPTAVPGSTPPPDPVGPEATALVPVRLGSKNFTESYIVAEMYGQMLEQAGLPVERRLDLGATDVAHAALLRGDIDLYPEYTSTGLMTVIKATAEPDAAAEKIYRTVRDRYAEQFGLVWLDPAPFNNPQALATTNEVAEAMDLHSYSDVAAKAATLTLGAPPEFIAREDGLRALQAAYGPFEFRSVLPLEPAQRYPALTRGDVDVVLAFGTDGQINGLGLVLLEDDKRLYPPYQVAPVVRREALSAHPQMAERLNEVSRLLTTDIMQALNWQVDGPDGLSPAEAATAFLRDKGMLP
jgi:osmoprotectant transport system substrate-binding protein